MTSITLFYMKMKQGINSLFIYSKKGWGLVLFELVGLVSIIQVIMQRYLYTEETSLIILLAFISLLGYSYLSAEKYLSSAENRFDLLTGVEANNIIWAIYGQVFWRNLSVVSLFPLILVASTKTISPWLILLTFLVFLLAATLLACLFNILINRYWKRMAGVFYLLFSLLWGGAIVAILGFLLADHNLSFGTLDKNDTLLIILMLGAVVITTLLFSSTLSGLWKEAYLQNESMNKTRLPFKRFKRFCRLFASSFIVKEWFLLWRNSITKIRFIVWVALIIICSFTTLKSYLYDPTLFLIISLAVWLFCFGELPATAWQTEGEQKSFYWLSGFKPSQLITAKIFAFLPLTVFGIITPLFLGLAVQLSFNVILPRAGLIFWLVLAAIIITLAIACLGHNSSKQIINNAMLEQVPLTMSAILAVCIEFLFCCVALLPFLWMVILSIAIPILCLLGQAMWLSRIYYSTRQPPTLCLTPVLPHLSTGTDGIISEEAALDMDREELIRFAQVSKTYDMGEVKVEALKESSFNVYRGELMVILGPSGSGKSTLLNLMGGLDTPTSGQMFFGKRNLSQAQPKELNRYRRNDVGFVFQFYNLIPDLTAYENVALAAELVDNPIPVEEVMEEVGLKERLHHFPSQLSGGEQQRIAIARALVKRPRLLLCDEPTGALDDHTGKIVLGLLARISRKEETTVIIVTHNTSIGQIADRTLRMRSGQVVEIIKNAHPLSPERIEW